MKTKCEKYVEARLSGQGRRAAGRSAGYASVPPSSAEEMYQMVEQLRGMPQAIKWVSDRIDQREKELEDLRRQKRAATIAKHLGVVTAA